MRIELMPRIHQIPHRYQYSAIILLGQITDFIVLAEYLSTKGLLVTIIKSRPFFMLDCPPFPVPAPDLIDYILSIRSIKIESAYGILNTRARLCI